MSLEKPGFPNGGSSFKKNGEVHASRGKNDLMGSGKQFENPMLKREEFAVQLRKKKSIEMVKAKRRKIIES